MKVVILRVAGSVLLGTESILTEAVVSVELDVPIVVQMQILVLNVKAGISY